MNLSWSCWIKTFWGHTFMIIIRVQILKNCFDRPSHLSIRWCMSNFCDKFPCLFSIQEAQVLKNFAVSVMFIESFLTSPRTRLPNFHPLPHTIKTLPLSRSRTLDNLIILWKFRSFVSNTTYLRRWIFSTYHLCSFPWPSIFLDDKPDTDFCVLCPLCTFRFPPDT